MPQIVINNSNNNQNFGGDVGNNAVNFGANAQIMQTITNANIAPELKDTLLQLAEAVKTMQASMPAEESNKAEKHLKKLVEEASEKEPDREWYEVSINGLTKAAENLNDLGKPVISLAGKVLKLLSGGL